MNVEPLANLRSSLRDDGVWGTELAQSYIPLARS